MDTLLKHSRFVACSITAVAGICSTIGSTVIQYLFLMATHKVTLFQVIFFRSVIQLVIISIIMWKRRIRPFNGWKQFGNCNLLAFSDSCTNLTFYASLYFIPIADSILILLTRPVFTYLLSCVALSERISRQDIGAGLLSCFGVVVLSRPDFLPINTNWLGSSPFTSNRSSLSLNLKANGLNDHNQYVLGVSLAIVCSIAGAVNYVSNKLVGQTEDLTLTILYPSFLGTICASFVVIINQETMFNHDLSSWISFLWIGIFAFYSFMLTAEAFQLEDATPLCCVRNLDAVYGTILQIIVIKVLPTWSSMIGSGIIITSSLWMTLRRLWMN